MSVLSWIAGILAIAIYIPLCIQVFSGKVQQNFATWILWAALDFITAMTIVVQNGNFLLPTAYALGSIGVALSIIRSKNFKWTVFDTVVACLVVVCVIVWSTSGAKVATIAGTIAVTVAGVPQAIDAWKRPHEQPLLSYSLFSISNCLSIAGGKNWSIEERFYPFVCTILTFVIVFLVARKFWIPNPKSRIA